MLEGEFASLAHLVPDKTLTSWFSILQYESFHSVGLFGEALGRGTRFGLFLCSCVYLGKEKCLQSLFCSLWVCPPTVLWQPGLKTDFDFIMRSLKFSLRDWNIVLHLSNSKLPAGRNMSKAVLCCRPFCFCPCFYRHKWTMVCKLCLWSNSESCLKGLALFPSAETK